jgi:hypothetical protein
MFGFTRRRRFLDYDYIPLVVNRQLRDSYEEEEESDVGPLAAQGEGEADAACADPRAEVLDAADDRERITLPAL